ncbi:MAG TPA: 2-amino-4-hydroxy-6-hydroxymethyldihydropteridine diphosphokinase [Anaerolineaceae bacterium]|nr:2-amino-4-hydroxy-6-hydroxymethyldihydropteridine diphosphokinase [Anaerolineaceae bacterium]
MHHLHLLVGSNIEAQQNIKAAMKMLESVHPIKACSRIWKTIAYGSQGPDFLNIALCVETDFSVEEYKKNVIVPIEIALKRQRFPDKNAPRTIDLDIIVYDGEVIDTGLWDKFFITVPIADLLPELKDPVSGLPLRRIAQSVIEQGLATFYANCLEP